MKLKSLWANNIISLPGAIALVAIIYFIVQASIYIASPGIYYDEITFLNAALGGLNDSFVSQRIFGIPVMIMPYIGALKSYLFYPVFKIFGVSAATIRIPVILISGVTLWLWYRIGKIAFNNALLSAWFVLILATDPAFIFQTKFDWGPIVLQVFFASFVIYLFLRVIDGASVHVLWLVYLALILGLYNKLNFIWFIGGFGVSSLLVYHRVIIRLWKTHGRTFIVPLGIFLSLLITTFILVILPVSKLNVGPPAVPLPIKIAKTVQLYLITMNGAGVYQFVTGHVLRRVSWVNIINSIVFIVWFFWLIFNRKKMTIFARIINRRIIFFLVMFGAIFIQIVLTRQSGGPHHIMMLWPLNQLIMFLMLIVISTSWTTYRLSAFYWSMSFLLISTLLFSQQVAVNGYLQTFRNGSSYSPKWSPKIYTLTQFVNENIRGADYVISADWGTGNQIFAMAPDNSDRLKCIDSWPWFVNLEQLSNSERDWFFKTYFYNKKDLVILYSKRDQVMPNVRANFFTFMNTYHCSYKLVKAISGGSGQIIYEVYETGI